MATGLLHTTGAAITNGIIFSKDVKIGLQN